jgi:hypothetical protein
MYIGVGIFDAIVVLMLDTFISSTEGISRSWSETEKAVTKKRSNCDSKKKISV